MEMNTMPAVHAKPVPAPARLNIPRYGDLLKRFSPKIIETKEENRRAIKVLEELAAIENRTAEENALLDLLATLIDRFEREAFPIPESTPREILAFLLEANDMKPADVAGLMGGRSRVSDVLAGKREISKEQAKKLAARFHVSPALFI